MTAVCVDMDEATLAVPIKGATRDNASHRCRAGIRNLARQQAAWPNHGLWPSRRQARAAQSDGFARSWSLVAELRPPAIRIIPHSAGQPRFQPVTLPGEEPPVFALNPAPPYRFQRLIGPDRSEAARASCHPTRMSFGTRLAAAIKRVIVTEQDPIL